MKITFKREENILDFRIMNSEIEPGVVLKKAELCRGRMRPSTSSDEPKSEKRQIPDVRKQNREFGHYKSIEFIH